MTTSAPGSRRRGRQRVTRTHPPSGRSQTHPAALRAQVMADAPIGPRAFQAQHLDLLDQDRVKPAWRGSRTSAAVVQHHFTLGAAIVHPRGPRGSTHAELGGGAGLGGLLSNVASDRPESAGGGIGSSGWVTIGLTRWADCRGTSILSPGPVRLASAHRSCLEPHDPQHRGLTVRLQPLRESERVQGTAVATVPANGAAATARK